MKRFRCLVVAVVVAFFIAPGRAEAKTKLDWNPEHTCVFVVGILQWEHADIWSSFPECMKDRRDFAWKVVEALLLPIKVQLPDGGAQVDVPLWQTWYDGVGPTNETKELFTLFFQKLKANPSADLATIADQALADQATKDLSQSVTTENFTATLTQNVGATISTEFGGQGSTLFSPAFVKHLMVSAKQVENCKQTGITPTTLPPNCAAVRCHRSPTPSRLRVAGIPVACAQTQRLPACRWR